MFNSLPRSFNCLRTESADFCSLNGRTIRTDCRSGVDLPGGASACLDVIKLEIIERIRRSGYSHVDNRYKKSLIITMLDGAFQLSSTWSLFHEECIRLNSLFLQLAYPERLIHSMISKHK